MILTFFAGQQRPHLDQHELPGRPLPAPLLRDRGAPPGVGRGGVQEAEGRRREQRHEGVLEVGAGGFCSFGGFSHVAITYLAEPETINIFPDCNRTINYCNSTVKVLDGPVTVDTNFYSFGLC